MHFSVIVVGDPDATLEEYGQEFEVNPYVTQCGCVHMTENGKPSETCVECGGKGEITSTYNYNCQWDWYMIGGRWQGELLVHNPDQNAWVGEIPSWFSRGKAENYDQALAGNIDWDAMQKRAHTRRQEEMDRRREVMFRNLPEADNPRVSPLDTQVDEDYVERANIFDSFCAVLDGSGWQDVDDDNRDVLLKMLQELPPETLVSVVDCHN